MFDDDDIDVVLDGVNSQQQKLTHPTTDRPRAPSRRPPTVYQNTASPDTV